MMSVQVKGYGRHPFDFVPALFLHRGLMSVINVQTSVEERGLGLKFLQLKLESVLCLGS